MKGKIFSFALIALLASVSLPVIGQTNALSQYVDAKGNISFPSDFRSKFAYLGNWSLKGQTHEVYTQPESIAAFRRTGKFPDGTVLVKEVRKSATAVKTTGEVEYPSDKVLLWFVMVKGDPKRYPGNPHWADGWGWALFKADAPMKQVAKSYSADCESCHIPAAATDHVYIEGYPILHNIKK